LLGWQTLTLIYRGVPFLSIAKAFSPLAEPVDFLPLKAYVSSKACLKIKNTFKAYIRKNHFNI
jgi:hypothetical protein